MYGTNGEYRLEGTGKGPWVAHIAQDASEEDVSEEDHLGKIRENIALVRRDCRGVI